MFNLTLRGAVIFGTGPARLPSYCWIDWTCDCDSLSCVPLTQDWLPSREHRWKRYLQSIRKLTCRWFNGLRTPSLKAVRGSLPGRSDIVGELGISRKMIPPLVKGYACETW